MTHGAKNGGSFPKHIKLTTVYIWVVYFTYTLTQTRICIFIIPHANFPYKTSIDERLIFYNITRCYSNREYCHMFAIAAGDIIKYQGGHMMRNADARTFVHVRRRSTAMADMTHDLGTSNSK